ncbi:MAG: hypothetical protein ACOYOP_04560 [Microthrixaceae bacterium]
MSTGTEPTTGTAPAVVPSGFDLLFLRAYPAAVGLVLRVVDRHRQAPERSREMAEEIVTGPLTTARIRNLDDSDRSLARVIGWTADELAEVLVGHPGRVGLPPGLHADELLPSDLVAEGAAVDLVMEGLALDELQDIVSSCRPRVRRIGIVCLGAGLSPEDTAALLGETPARVADALARIGRRLGDRRRAVTEERWVDDEPSFGDATRTAPKPTVWDDRELP